MNAKLLVFLWLLGGAALPAQTIEQQLFAVGGASHVSDMDLPKPTHKGSVLLAMPGPLRPGVKVTSITDNSPDGGNTYKQVPNAASSCARESLDIWYCENCNGGVTEIKYHFGSHVSTINSFLEVSGLELSSVLDGSGANVTDGSGTSEGLNVGPSIKTTAKDFIIARYASSADLTGVVPAPWEFKSTYVYAPGAPAGTYQPKLTGAGKESNFCMSVAAFKVAVSAETPSQASVTKHSQTRQRSCLTTKDRSFREPQAALLVVKRTIDVRKRRG